MQRSFYTLMMALRTPPVLAMPNDSGRDHAIGAVLSLRQGGLKRMVAYASRSLDKRERNYCVTRKELLAVVYFLFILNNICLGEVSRSVQTMLYRHTPDPIGQQARWLDQMEEFNFAIKHRPGVQNSNADALSRHPCFKKHCVCHGPANK